MIQSYTLLTINIITISLLQNGWEQNEILTHWGQVTHIFASNLTIIGSDNGLWPDWHQAIIETNSGRMLIGPLETNFNEILFEVRKFWYEKTNLKMLSAKWQPFCLGLNVLINQFVKAPHPQHSPRLSGWPTLKLCSSFKWWKMSMLKK